MGKERGEQDCNRQKIKIQQIQASPCNVRVGKSHVGGKGRRTYQGGAGLYNGRRIMVKGAAYDKT